MKSLKKHYKNYLIILIGNLLIGFSYGALLIPKEIVAGGSSGFALLLSQFIDLSPTILVAITVWSFFLIGLLVLGKQFSFKTLIGTIFLPIGTAIPSALPWLLDEVAKIQQLWSLAFVAGVIAGAGIGLTFKAGGSSGGFDILGYIIQKYLHIKITWVIFFFDAIIMIVGIFLFSLENVLIGICVAFIFTIVADRILFNTNELQAQIITKSTEETLTYIHEVLDRGSTIINIHGGYSKNPYPMIQVLLNKRELTALKKHLEDIDPGAFVSIIKANSIIGEGFKSWRDI